MFILIKYAWKIDPKVTHKIVNFGTLSEKMPYYSDDLVLLAHYFEELRFINSTINAQIPGKMT